MKWHRENIQRMRFESRGGAQRKKVPTLLVSPTRKHRSASASSADSPAKRRATYGGGAAREPTARSEHSQCLLRKRGLLGLGKCDAKLYNIAEMLNIGHVIYNSGVEMAWEGQQGYGAGDVLRLLLDSDAGTLAVKKNGTLLGVSERADGRPVLGSVLLC
jgi:hypothetical protein